MKRLVAVLVVVALVMTGAFAQISFSGWGTGVLGVKGGAGADDASLFLQTPWGANTRVGFTIAGNSDNIGFQADMTADITSIGLGDNAKIWWKANDVLKVSIGKVQGDVLRGKIGDWSDFRGILGGMGDADAIFRRFYPQNGALVEVTPVDGLYMGAAFEASGNAKDVKNSLQAAVGYNIEGIGLVRAQYIGGDINKTDNYVPAKPSFVFDPETGASKPGHLNDKNEPIYVNDPYNNGGMIEVAFAPAFVDGATIDIGAKIPLDAEKAKYDAKVSAGAAFNIGAVAVSARVDSAFGVIYWSESAGANVAKNTFNVFVTPSMGLDFATIGLDASVYMGTDNDSEVGFGVAPWIQKGYSNGFVKAGVAITKATTPKAKLGWAVPVAFQYWF